jgi:hypothetical protein
MTVKACSEAIDSRTQALSEPEIGRGQIFLDRTLCRPYPQSPEQYCASHRKYAESQENEGESP